MKNPPPQGEGSEPESFASSLLDTAAYDAQAAKGACPFAADCRRRWIHITGTETADCAYCYQNLNRAEMARILAGNI